MSGPLQKIRSEHNIKIHDILCMHVDCVPVGLGWRDAIRIFKMIMYVYMEPPTFADDSKNQNSSEILLKYTWV